MANHNNRRKSKVSNIMHGKKNRCAMNVSHVVRYLCTLMRLVKTLGKQKTTNFQSKVHDLRFGVTGISYRLALRQSAMFTYYIIYPTKLRSLQTLKKASHCCLTTYSYHNNISLSDR